MKRFGQKNGPLGPTRAAGLLWTGPRRYLLEVSILVCRLRGRTAHTSAPTRDAAPTIAERFRALDRLRCRRSSAGLRAVVSRAPRRPPPAGRPRTSSPRRSSTRVAARSSSASTSASASLPAALPGLALGLDLAPALAGEARDHHPPVGLGAHPFDVAGVGEVVEHLGDRRGRQPRGGGELAGRQLAALVELDQQLELRVAELRAAEVRVAPAQAAERCGTRGGSASPSSVSSLGSRACGGSRPGSAAAGGGHHARS